MREPRCRLPGANLGERREGGRVRDGEEEEEGV